jgi:hypothetical protein
MPRAPRATREFFDLFALYTSERGLNGMLRDVDFAGTDPRQIYFSLHGRAPEKREFAIPGPDFSPSDKYVRGFRSAEFRRNLIARFLEAYPEKQRLLFIHIPKAAGSQLSARLMGKFPFLVSQMLEPGWGSDDDICRALRDAVTGLSRSNQLLICGHNTLERYRSWRAMRYDDQLFAVVRDPVLATISQVNYILTRIYSQEPQPKPDTIGWRRIFGVQNVEETIDRATSIELARRVLRDQGVVPPNVACHFLGGSTAESALDHVVCHDVELTDTVRLDQWCRDKWGIEETGKSNESKPYIRLDDLSSDDKQHIASITSEDARLYARVEERLSRSGRSSVRGLHLA